MTKLWQVVALLVLCASPAYGQQCKARPISGTAPNSGGSLGVFLNGELTTQHTTARGAVRAAEALMEVDSLAQVVVVDYLWMIYQTNKGADCAPRSPRPPWPISLVGCPSCPPTVTVHDTVPDPLTEAALASCQAELGLCSMALADALARIDSLLALPAPEPVLPPPDSVVVLPDSLAMVVPDTFLFTAVLWLEDVAYVCVDAGVVEAKIAEDRSRACAIQGGARSGACLTAQPLLTVGREEPCPSAF